MKNCIHIIGQLLGNKDLVTFEELTQRVKEENKIKEIWILNCGANCKIHPLKDYLDMRKNTGFIRFNYCFKCGAKIDWAKKLG